MRFSHDIDSDIEIFQVLDNKVYLCQGYNRGEYDTGMSSEPNCINYMPPPTSKYSTYSIPIPIPFP